MEFAPAIVEKLRERAGRFHELTEQLADQEVASDPKRLTTVLKERGPLEEFDLPSLDEPDIEAPPLPPQIPVLFKAYNTRDYASGLDMLVEEHPWLEGWANDVGKGYYGLRVHQAVLDYGARITGCTVHFVDNQYDHGPIVAQESVPVLGTDTPDTLAARVMALERRLVPKVIQWIAEGRVHLEENREEGNRVRIERPV